MPLPQPSSLRDRTPEFLAVAERLQKLTPLGQTQNGAITHVPEKPKNSIQQQSEFKAAAAEIGHGVHRTSLKLQKLTQLAKRTSMFDDPSQEVDELTGMIKQDIQALNNQIAELQRLSARIKEGNKQQADHSHTVVDNLRAKLKDATQEFKDVLTMRQDNIKHHKDRQSLFTNNTNPEAVPLLPRPRPHQALASQASNGSSSFAPATPAVPSFLQSQQQQQQLALANPQDNYLSSRAEALRNVENTIVELGTIFNKLSEMVAEQGELAIRIDENVDDTLANVTNAQAQLVKYLNNISNNRWLIMKVFGVLLVFLVIFIFFIA